MAISEMTNCCVIKGILEPGYIERIHFENMIFIKEIANNALLSMHARADAASRSLRDKHDQAMDELVCAEIAFENQQAWEETVREFNENIAPFKSIDDWYDNLSDLDKRAQFDLMHEYDINNKEVDCFELDIIHMLRRRFRN